MLTNSLVLCLTVVRVQLYAGAVQVGCELFLVWLDSGQLLVAIRGFLPVQKHL